MYVPTVTARKQLPCHYIIDSESYLNLHWAPGTVQILEKTSLQWMLYAVRH